MADMTTDQAISLLDKMEVEQRTLRDLWGQFSVALSQLGSVLKHYREVKQELVGLEQKKIQLESDITNLEKNGAKRTIEVRNEFESFRKSLEEEIGPLDRQVKETRERVSAVQGALKEVEKRHTSRIQEMEEEIQTKESHLVKTKKAHDDFLKKIGAAA